MNNLRKIGIMVLSFLFGVIFLGNSTLAKSAPNFKDDFAKELTSDNGDSLYSPDGVSSKNTLKQNVEKLFFPTEGGGGALWNIGKYAGMVLVFISIVIAAAHLITSLGKPEKLKEAVTSLLFILIGSLLFFGAVWIFRSGGPFSVISLSQTSGVEYQLTSAKGPLYFVLSFLKGAAFFVAIIMIVVAGFKMMNPKTGEGGDGKKIAKSLANVIFALVAMKVVDFIYYIASQDSFAKQAGDFIIQVIKFLAYLSGSLMVIMLIYGGYLLIIDGGKGDNFKKVKTLMINMILAVIALFFFLFILYQIFSEFGGVS